MNNPFDARLSALSGPARDCVPIVPDDAADLSEVAVALYAEVGGTIHVETEAGAERTIDVPSMTIFPLGVRKVFATGTDAGVKLHALVI